MCHGATLHAVPSPGQEIFQRWDVHGTGVITRKRLSELLTEVAGKSVTVASAAAGGWWKLVAGGSWWGKLVEAGNRWGPMEICRLRLMGEHVKTDL